MGGTEEVYGGGAFEFDPTYGIKENYGESFLGIDYRFPASQFGFPTDPTTANQLQAVSNKISTGTKVIEFSGLGITGGPALAHLEKIPKQHLEEVRRLKELTNIELTFHGPLVEATGFSRQGWQENDRERAEREMFTAVKRAHELDPKGNIIVTFHSSNGLPDPVLKEFNEQTKKEEVKEFVTVDDYSGQFNRVDTKTKFFENIDKSNPDLYLKKRNKEGWDGALQSVSFDISRGIQNILEVTERQPTDTEEIEKAKGSILEIYGKAGTPEGKKILQEFDPQTRKWIENRMNALTFGELNLRKAYQNFQELCERAYHAGDAQQKKKLIEFRDEIRPKLDYIKDPSKINLLAEGLSEGINVLKSVEPQLERPLREWAIDKASTTFGNVAFNSYKEFKSNDSSPIISIENPPAGSGLSRADDLRDLVKMAREKFIQRAKTELGVDEDKAKEKANQLIGITWDVGHINMIRGKGYGEKHLLEETEKVAPYIKHVHLSDNFGTEHTELPMGMGNVPTNKMLELIHQYNKKVKKIVETGDWYSRQGGLAQTQTPIRQTLTAFGSSVYSNGGPYWNQAAAITPGYFAGQGTINPDIHHSLYGSGFSNLPTELGGQMAGRSRVSGAPIE